MQLLSSQEINHVSGAFSAVKVLEEANQGALFFGALSLFFGSPGVSVASAMWYGAAAWGGISLVYQSAESFDNHYGTLAPSRTVTP